jgi:hypothetical protein
VAAEEHCECLAAAGLTAGQRAMIAVDLMSIMENDKSVCVEKMTAQLMREHLKRYPPGARGPRKRGQGFVYFALAKEVNRLKIGFSVNPVYRHSDLTRQSPIRIELVGLVEGTIQTEVALHQRFVRQWIMREWFDYSGELREYVESLGKEASCA